MDKKMGKDIKKISVIGDGGWGTTLALYLLTRGFAVKLWGAFPEYTDTMRKTRRNSKFLPSVYLDKKLELTSNLQNAFEKMDLIILAVPSKYITGVLKKIKKEQICISNKILVSVIKGIDNTNLLRMSEIIERELGRLDLCVLSGPTIAVELARQMPSTAVVASKKIKIAKIVQKIFNSDIFRIYANTDVSGVELGGSIKNIIAIACGLCDGLGYGSNTKSAIVTRGLAEMARLGKALGAKEKTFSGLSGLGDIVTTCFSPESRNRYVGEQLGKGKSIKDILSSMNMIAEGVETVKAVHKLSLKKEVIMPITKEVYEIIYRGRNPKTAVAALMNRKLQRE